MSKYVMTEDEQKLWRQVYAVAFVAEFNKDIEDQKEQIGWGNPFDRAAEYITAERACIVADLAVLRLRDYKDVKELAGQEINATRFI